MGIDPGFLYHSSVGAGVWQLFKAHKVTIARFAAAHCQPSAIPADFFSELYPILWADTSTVWTMRHIGWYAVNGASGVYHSAAHGVQDDLELIAAAQFDTWGEAEYWMYAPLSDANNRYYRMRVADYSVGDYLWNWICHSEVNAFSYWRWGITPVDEWVDEAMYYIYGNNGVAPPYDWRDHKHFGCVSGSNCFYNNSLPYAVGIFESKLFGEGYGLDVWWHPNKQEWWYSDASYTSIEPFWVMAPDYVGEGPGWQ
jgi:hypothetical protein